MKHLERHPRPVEGCFGCKAMGLQWLIPYYMTAKSDSNATREVYAETKRYAEQNRDKVVPTGSRWV